ncbi:MAG: NAD(P)/FAD-dependent oxidoreductase [Nitrospinota bacterium]
MLTGRPAAREGYDLVIAGGGASGLLAAGRAAELGLTVLVLEKMKKPGIKLSISGKGRCNITNSASLVDFIKRIKPDGRFLRQAFHRFFNTDTVEFFEASGVPVRLERGGRYFPESQRAGDIVHALLAYCKTHGVKIQTGSRVVEIVAECSRASGVYFRPAGSKKKERVSCKGVLLATGGNCYHSTGTTGDGYRIASLLGHSVTRIFAAQAPVDLHMEHLVELKGLHLKNVLLSLWRDGRRLSKEFGEMNFTGTGVSGPIVLKLSRLVSEYLLEGKKSLSFEIDLKPAVDGKTLDNRLIKRVNEIGKKNMETLLKEFLPKQLIKSCCKINAINPEMRALELGADARKRLRNWMKCFILPIDAVRPIDEAIVTAGGICLREVNPRTMESKIVESLFFSGEILDVDADTGGFNLQAAFSTGILAAESAHKKLQNL